MYKQIGKVVLKNIFLYVLEKDDEIQIM